MRRGRGRKEGESQETGIKTMGAHDLELKLHGVQTFVGELFRKEYVIVEKRRWRGLGN